MNVKEDILATAQCIRYKRNIEMMLEFGNGSREEDT